MRRLLVIVIVIVLVLVSPMMLALVAPAASAGSLTRESSSSRRFYTAWRQREKIGSESYFMIHWEIAVWDTVEGSQERFRANVLRIAYRCTVTTSDGTECVTASRLFGSRRGSAVVGFTMDKGLATASISGTWRLSHLNHDELGDQKTVHIADTLTARGEPSRWGTCSTTWDGNCPATRYRSRFALTKALADVTIAGDFEETGTGLSNAWLDNRNDSVVHRSC